MIHKKEESWTFPLMVNGDQVSCILTKMPRPFSGGKNNLLNKWFWDNWISTHKRMEIDFYLVLFTKINSK